VPGCGTSALSASLRRAGFARVVSVDSDAEIIAAMRARHPELDFRCADLTKPCSALVADGSADLIVDKATLDCLFCNPLYAHELCATIHRMLAADGRYVVLSLHDASYVAAFLGFWFS
jgi:trans-aconitate methyltransferase